MIIQIAIVNPAPILSYTFRHLTITCELISRYDSQAWQNRAE